MNNHHLIWFRNDLRITDNSALYFACKNQFNKVSALFIATPKQWLKHYDSPKKIVFMYEHLILLQNKLYDLGIMLYFYQTKYFVDSIKYVLKFSLKYKINHIFYNYQYEINEKKRDKILEKILFKHNIAVSGFHDSCLISPQYIQTQTGLTYKRFSPFYKKIIKQLKFTIPKCYPVPKKRYFQNIFFKKHIAYFDFPYENINKNIFPIGEELALNNLKKFFQNNFKKYVDKKNFLFKNYTSLVSAYLNIGVLSSRQCLNILVNYYPNIIYFNQKSDWFHQLIWKEFYQHLLEGYPLLSKNHSFYNWESKIPWSNNKKNLTAWKNGQTGYPIIDSGMRQLNKIGWINNRMRMITASFLVKNLLIDWRQGEKYFMSRLIDGNFSANNGGWQWIASVGVDSLSYLRIFNPVLQSKKFDPKGLYIRHYLPEINSVPKKYIHDPHVWIKKNNSQLNYPKPIIEYSKTRENTLLIFSQALKK
ncbi:Deoxyribodipyrimidine photo-lyase [Buchnera aphidicola (Eriosoma grossulariae)]|uniref:deoxyribodipyrimidine photo-lyase n=1 Tax=Buchnera aphidicola TaxID=9 RepID=UPI003463B132